MLLIAGCPIPPPPPWAPTDYQADARVFQANEGTSSAGSSIVARAGIVCAATGIKELDLSLTLAPLDGQGFFRLTSGRLLLVGGAPSGNAGARVNTVWYSDDDGETWDELLANEPGAETRFARGHSAGYIPSHDGYAYVIGGDPFDPNGEVWRTPLSGDGTTWTLVGSSAPTSTLLIFLYWSQGGNLYIAGGQTDISEPSSAVSTVWRSTDDGVTWTSLGSAPWTGRGMLSGPLPVLDGVAYLIGGGAYDLEGVSDTFRNDVWSFDGSTWTEVLANGHGQFSGVRYHTPVAHDGMLLFFNGSGSIGTEHAKGYASNDGGATWHYFGDQLEYAPWGNTHAAAGISVPGRILLTHGFQSDRIFSVVPHPGELLETWTDQGSEALVLSQATEADRPLLDTHGDMPVVVLTREQFMSLAALDDGGPGVFEVYAIASTLNFDDAADSPTAAPCTVIGNNDVSGSIQNAFGFSGGALRYLNYSGGYQNTDYGTAYNDDTVRVYGAIHEAGRVRLYVDGTLVADDTTNVAYTAATGWKSFGASYGNTGKGALAVYALVILHRAAASSDEFRTLLQTWKDEVAP